MAIEVLIASDQLILRKGLSALLKSARVHVVGEAVDGPGAVRLAQACCPDVVVLDLCELSRGNLAVAQRILQVSVMTKVILLTVRAEDQDVLPALQAGVSGYVLKTDAGDLAQAIQEVARGMTYLSRSVSSVVVKAYLTSTGPAGGHSSDPGRPNHPSHVGKPSSAATTQPPAVATGQRRLTAIMFTDMVGYSALTHENEPLALELVEMHNGLLRQRFVEHGGREIKAMGDGFLVLFASALDATRCAVAIQTAVYDRNAVESQEGKFHVRIGIHVGDVVHRGDDVFGQGVNIASRIEGLARPGGICVSEQVANLIRHAIDYPLIKLGKAALKNIPTPVWVHHIRLPWEERRAPLLDRVSFSILQKKTPSFADLTSAAFIATVAVLAIWQSATHEAIHAVVWFGEGPPGEARFLETPRAATLSLTDAPLGRISASRPEGVIVPASIAGAASSRARLLPAADRSIERMPAAQPEGPALMSCQHWVSGPSADIPTAGLKTALR